MLDRLSAIFHSKNKTDLENRDKLDMQVAATALLVEAACMDDKFDDSERFVISNLVRRRFNLCEPDCKILIAEAESAVADSTQLYGFTREVNDRFTLEQRVELMEMLWEVVYADGEAHDFEVALLRRIGGLMYVSDHDRASARQRVVRRLI